MQDCNEHATPPKSAKSTNSNFSVQIQIKPKFQFGFVSREIPRTLNVPTWWISGVQHFQWKLSYWTLDVELWGGYD